MVRILIVEDDADFREEVLGELEARLAAGHEVRAAGTVEEALARLQDWQPQLLLVDLGLPGTQEDARAGRTEPLAGATIPHEVQGRFGAGHVLLKPAGAGTGVIAGAAVRAVVELAGVGDILTKCIGTRNPHNMLKATFDALAQLKDPVEVARVRGLPLEHLQPARD